MGRCVAVSVDGSHSMSSESQPSWPRLPDLLSILPCDIHIGSSCKGVGPDTQTKCALGFWLDWGTKEKTKRGFKESRNSFRSEYAPPRMKCLRDESRAAATFTTH